MCIRDRVKAGVGNVLKNHPLNKPANVPRLYNPQDIVPITPLEVAPNPLFNDTIQPGPRNPVTGKIDPIDTTPNAAPVSYTHLRAHETPEHLVCRLLLEKK